MPQISKKYTIIRSLLERKILNNPEDLNIWIVYFYFEIKNRFLNNVKNLLMRFFIISKKRKKIFFKFFFLKKIIKFKFFSNKMFTMCNKKYEIIKFFYSILKIKKKRKAMYVYKTLFKNKNLQISRLLRCVSLIKLEIKHGQIECGVFLFESFFFYQEINIAVKTFLKLKLFFFFLKEKKRNLFYFKYLLLKKIKGKKNLFSFSLLNKFILNLYPIGFFCSKFFLKKKFSFFLKTLNMRAKNFSVYKLNNIKFYKIVEILILFQFESEFTFILFSKKKNNLLQLFLNSKKFVIFLFSNFFLFVSNFITIFEKILNFNIFKQGDEYQKFNLKLNFNFLEKSNLKNYHISKKYNWGFFFCNTNSSKRNNINKKYVFYFIDNKLLLLKIFYDKPTLSSKFCLNMPFFKLID